MQYVKKKVSTSDSLRTGESHKSSLCYQNRDNLSTHIFNMGSGGAAASRNFLKANDPSPCEQDFFCELGKVLAVPNLQLSRRSKKISKLPSLKATSAIYCLKLLLEKIHPSRNLLALVPGINQGQWALYLSKLVTPPFRLATLFSELSIGKYLANSKFLSSWMRIHRNIYQVFLTYSQFLIFRRLLIRLVSIPPG